MKSIDPVKLVAETLTLNPSLAPKDSREFWYEKRIQELEAKNEALELVASYAKDVIDFWPLMTLRTIRVMIPKMASLKEALEMLRGQDRS